MRFFLLLAASLTVTVASWLRRDRCPHERTTLSDPWACRLCGVLMP